jgi:hypothetical protein
MERNRRAQKYIKLQEIYRATGSEEVSLNMLG